MKNFYAVFEVEKKVKCFNSYRIIKKIEKRFVICLEKYQLGTLNHLLEKNNIKPVNCETYKFLGFCKNLNGNII